MTPILQTSTAFPYGFCAKTSGAIKHTRTNRFQILINIGTDIALMYVQQRYFEINFVIIRFDEVPCFPIHVSRIARISTFVSIVFIVRVRFCGITLNATYRVFHRCKNSLHTTCRAIHAILMYNNLPMPLVERTETQRFKKYIFYFGWKIIITSKVHKNILFGPTSRIWQQRREKVERVIKKKHENDGEK